MGTVSSLSWGVIARISIAVVIIRRWDLAAQTNGGGTWALWRATRTELLETGLLEGAIAVPAQTSSTVGSISSRPEAFIYTRRQ